VIDPLVRRAEPTDAPALASLEHEARVTVFDGRGGRRWLEEHPEVGGGWADAVAGGIVLVAELPEPAVPQGPGHVVGYLVLDVAGAVARVDQVYVTPGAREVGFGDALLAAAEEEARRAGATVLEGEALPGDRETKNLYERAGITARKITVSRRLT
jgi:GNAT superfamily N-acetyltransferase